MDLKTFIAKMEALNLTTEQIFSYLYEWIEVTEDVMLDSINAGDCTINAALSNGLDVIYDRATEDVNEAPALLKSVAAWDKSIEKYGYIN